MRLSFPVIVLALTSMPFAAINGPRGTTSTTRPTIVPRGSSPPAAASTSLVKKDSCASDRAHAWVAAAVAASATLPTTLAELNGYAMTYRRAVFGAVSPAVRQKLWKEQLTAVLAEDKSLTDSQMQLIRLVRDDLPLLFAEHGQDRARLSRLGRVVKATFDQEKATRIFGQLGPDDQDVAMRRTVQYRVSAAARVMPVTWVRSFAARSIVGPPRATCSCNVGSWFGCSVLFSECRSHSGCTVGGHCGFLWGYDCDGDCTSAQM